MPIYEFKCSRCGIKSEHLLSYADYNKRLTCDKAWTNDPKIICEGDLIKQVSSTTFKLNGGAWASEGYTRRTK